MAVSWGYRMKWVDSVWVNKSLETEIKKNMPVFPWDKSWII